MNEFANLTAQEIGSKVGIVDIQPRIGADKVDAREVRPDLMPTDHSRTNWIENNGSVTKTIGQKGGVLAARLAGRESQNTPEQLAEERGERRAKGWTELNSSEFLQSVLDEEKAIVAGEKDWEGRVTEFLGNPSREADPAVDGDLGEKARGSFAKLEKMKGRAAAHFEKMTEIAGKLGKKTVIEVGVEIDALHKEPGIIDEERATLVSDVMTNLLEMGTNPKKQEKLLKKLGMSVDYIEAVSEEGDIATFADYLSQALDGLSERTDDGKKVSTLVNIQQLGRNFGKDNQLVKSWVDRKIKIEDRYVAYKEKVAKNRADYDDFVAEQNAMFPLLTRIASREKLNSEIVGVVEGKVNEARGEYQDDKRNRDLLEEQRRLAGERIAHEDKVDAAEKLVAMTREMEALKVYANSNAEVAQATLSVIAYADELNGERKQMLDQIKTGELPVQLREIVGGEAYKSVEKFVRTGKGDITQVENFLSQVTGIMADKEVESVNGTPRSEFLSQGFVEVGGKRMEVGTVIGVSTDKGVYEISSAQRNPDTGETVVNEASVLYFPHAEIRQYVEDIKISEARIANHKQGLGEKKGSKRMAGTDNMADQHAQRVPLLKESIKREEAALVANRQLLAETLKPLGGDDKSFAKALNQMGKSQEAVVESMYRGALAEAATEVAEMLGVAPSEVTPAMLAVAHVEAVRVSEAATNVLGFLEHHDERMNAAVGRYEGQLTEFAVELADLEQSRKAAEAIPHAGTRARTLEAVAEAEKKVGSKAKGLARKLETEFVKSTPDALKADRDEIASVLSSQDVANRASELLSDIGLSEYATSMDRVAVRVMNQTGMVDGLVEITKETRDALSVLVHDSRSQTLMRALDEGNSQDIINRIVENVKVKKNSELAGRREAVGSNERELNPENMTGEEKAEAFLRGDVRQDAIVEAVAASVSVEDVQAFFDKMGGLALESDAGSAAYEDFSSRVIELLLEAEDQDETGDALHALLEENTENWSEMLTIMGSLPGRNRSILRHAVDIATEIIEEKKN